MAKTPYDQLIELQNKLIGVYHDILDASAVTEDMSDDEKLMASMMLTPAMLGQVNTFLKNNEITTQPEDTTERLTELERKLKAKRKAGSEKLSGNVVEAQERFSE